MIKNAQKKPHTKYVLLAIEAIKQHIAKAPFQFKTAAELHNYLNTPNRCIVEKAFKDVNAAGIKEWLVKKCLEKSKILLE